MLKAVIVDDEPLARDELSYLLRRSKKVDVVGEAESLDDALVKIEELLPDVVFIDIQLAEGNGVDLARKLFQFHRQVDVVFATAFDEYALEAFDLNAADYILKPYDEQRIVRTVEKVAKRREYSADRNMTTVSLSPKAHPTERIDKLAITIDDRIRLIQIRSIIYISATEGKTIIATDEGHYTLSEPLITLEQKLEGTSILRVHRSYLVNMDNIVEIQPWFHSTYNLIMKDKSHVPVSRTYVKQLKQTFGF